MATAKLRWLVLLLPLLTIACGADKPTSATKAQSTSVGAPHGPAEVNLMAQPVFKGRALDPVVWRQLEAFALAGPTNLIVADLLLVPDQMTQAGFDARWTVQLYALSREYAGTNWSPAPGDPESQALYDLRQEIDTWWAGYVGAVVQLMQKAPQTTALIIVNDGHDRLGRTLGTATLRQMAPVANRVTLGDTVPD